MGARISDEIMDQIRNHFDIVDVVGQVVQLKKSGKNFFGLCPFHAENTPSFTVSPEKQIYHCFGCKAGGDTIKFVMDTEQMSFIEAIRHLADQAGIILPDQESKRYSPEDDLRNKMREALELSAKLFHHVLLQTDYGQHARHYLEKRKITIEAIREFQIGFAPSSYDFLLSFLKGRQMNEEVMEKAGLIVKKETQSRHRYFDRFRGRIMFPLHDAQGRIVGFGGRLIDSGQPKYLNSPETVLFHKSNHLFNIHRARPFIRKDDQVILFEGYMDVISAWQAGIRTSIATQGTSLTSDHIKVIKRNTKNVYLCFDSDHAGRTASDRGIELLKNESCTVKVASVPVDMDPDDYIRRFGATSFREEILGGALSVTAYQLETLKKNYALEDSDDRMQYLNEAITIISELPVAIEQDHYIRKLSEEFRISLDAMKEELRKKKKQKHIKRDKHTARWNNGYQEGSKHTLGIAKTITVTEKSERLLIAYMMRDRSIIQWVRDEIGADFNTDLYAALAAYLYYYCEENDNEMDTGRFISSLSDPALIPVATELAMLELPAEPSAEALTDYVRHIRNYPLLQEIEMKEKQIEQLSRADEPVKAAKLSVEITQLRKKIKMG
ncbi:DNA primase [Hazenella sp. IB182357]|uniref:DNA primase n=1 Tax=Polycladospora coralii TaxID=2771432 RepID=A0A926N752_9BACL|nr:DNA primase [Polycladospora coralii]MBD1371181.1 DNA primase [Polycladospora coralii]MBS7530123.1 DNA primase [Polycladospora coralii]